MRVRGALARWVMVALVSACATEEHSGSTAAHGSHEVATSDAVGLEDSAALVICASDGSEVDHYVPGIQHASPSTRWTVTLLEATPSPPDKGHNSFRFKLSDGAGAPVSGAIIDAIAEMPKHGHGTYPPSFRAQSLGGGEYRVPAEDSPDALDLFMPGAWTIHFRIGGDGENEMVDFVFCLEG